MKKQYEYYLKQIDSLSVRKMATKALVTEQVMRLYINGKNAPRLKTAILLEKEFDIECEFWVINKEKAND